MAVTISQRPVKTQDSITSRWTAAHNPVIYKFQRRDRSITSVTVVGSQLVLALNSAAGLTTGVYVYMNTTKYKGGVLIENIISNNIYVTGLPLNGNDGAGYLNDTKRNYKIDIKIYESGSNKLLGATSCVPFNNGNGTKDLGVYVSSYLKLLNTFTYDVVNKRDINASVKFYITYQEIWTGGSSSLSNDSANPVFAVNAAKQIGEKYGQNMHEYVVLHPTNRSAKFLTKFKRPVYFTGKPFSIGFIYSEQLSVQLTKNEAHLNINKLQIDDGSELLDPDQVQGVNNLMLAGDYDPAVKFIRLKLMSGQPVAPGYVYPGYVNDGYVAQP